MSGFGVKQWPEPPTSIDFYHAIKSPSHSHDSKNFSTTNFSNEKLRIIDYFQSDQFAESDNDGLTSQEEQANAEFTIETIENSPLRMEEAPARSQM